MRQPSDNFKKAVRFDSIGASLRTELAVEHDRVTNQRCFTSLGVLNPECCVDSWNDEVGVEGLEVSCGKCASDPTCADVLTFTSMSTTDSLVLPIQRASMAAVAARAEQLRDARHGAAGEGASLEDEEEREEGDPVTQDRSHHRCQFTSLRRLMAVCESRSWAI